MCKEWGFLLQEVFGNSLGTGDYGHISIEHAPMLMRRFRSMREYSNQGFESCHKLQGLLFSKATSHDGPGEATSSCLLLYFLCFSMISFSSIVYVWKCQTSSSL